MDLQTPCVYFCNEVFDFLIEFVDDLTHRFKIQDLLELFAFLFMMANVSL